MNSSTLHLVNCFQQIFPNFSHDVLAYFFRRLYELKETIVSARVKACAQLLIWLVQDFKSGWCLTEEQALDVCVWIHVISIHFCFVNNITFLSRPKKRILDTFSPVLELWWNSNMNSSIVRCKQGSLVIVEHMRILGSTDLEEDFSFCVQFMDKF